MEKKLNKLAANNVTKVSVPNGERSMNCDLICKNISSILKTNEIKSAIKVNFDKTKNCFDVDLTVPNASECNIIVSLVDVMRHAAETVAAGVTVNFKIKTLESAKEK